MKANVFFILILLIIWPIAFAAEQAAPNTGASDGQITIIRVVGDDKSKKGQTNDRNEEEITKGDIKKKETRRKIAERNKNENFVIEDEESTDETLEGIVEEDGISSDIAGMPETTLERATETQVPEPKKKTTQTAEQQTSGSQQGGQGTGSQSESQQQQSSGMDMSSLQQMLPIIIQLLGLMKEQPTQQQSTAQQTPPQPEKPTAITCSSVGGNVCSELKYECSNSIVTQDVYGSQICCLSECKPFRNSNGSIEAQQNIATAKSEPSTGFQIIGDGTTLTSLNGATRQSTTLLNKATDTILTRTDGIDVLNGNATNLYTLSNTRIGVTNHYGIFLLDPIGQTLISVGEENGALVMDDESLLLWLAPGVTKYYNGIYETNTRIFSAQTGIILEPTFTNENSITGMASFSEPKVAFTLGNGRLSELLKNSIDVSFAQRESILTILAKGDEDMLLLGRGGFFPLVIRRFAKGDTNIVNDVNVKVNQNYKIKDVNYEYSILSESEYTKVKLPNGKIIEESSGIELKKLSNLQQQLIAKGK